jgi:hypothetical protein
MSPSLLGLGLASFASTLCLHVLWWRISRPKNDLRALFALFLILPSVLALILAAASDWPAENILAVLLLDLALASAYVQTYPIFHAISPSLEILLLVNRAPGGLTADEISGNFNDAHLVGSRVQDLLRTNLARFEDGAYRLAPAGKAMIRAFLIYRKIIGMPFRGG